jgi:GDP-L-fucose synthase
MFDPTGFESFEFVETDCRQFFSESASSEAFDLAIHLAAVVGGRLTIERNPLAVAEDLAIDAAFWTYAVATRPGHIVSFSSSAAYPVHLQSDTNHIVLHESDLQFSSDMGMPDMSYGWAKLTNEYLGTLAHTNYGLSVACYRPFSGYGEDQDLSYPFRSICQRALEHDSAQDFMVWGSGLQGRDFIHVSDVVEAVMQTYPTMVDGSAVNLSTGRLTTFVELAHMFLRELGKSVQVVGDTSMPAGVFARVGSPRLLGQRGYTAKVTLEEGVARAVEFHTSVRNAADQDV